MCFIFHDLALVFCEDGRPVSLIGPTTSSCDNRTCGERVTVLQKEWAERGASFHM